MKFQRKEKIVVLIALLMITVIGGAFTWDILTTEDDDSGRIGKPVELVLEKEKDNGTLVPPQSIYAGHEGYDSLHQFKYTLNTKEDTSDSFLINVNFDLSLEDLNEDEVYTALKPKIVYNGEEYSLSQGLNEMEIELDGNDQEVTLEIALNPELKGSGIGIGRIANNDYQYNIEFFIDSLKTD